MGRDRAKESGQICPKRTDLTGSSVRSGLNNAVSEPLLGTTVHTTPQPVSVLVAGHLIKASEIRVRPEAFAEGLELARREYGHALCNCRKPPLKLVIRERNAKLHLASWPDQGHLHAAGCPFYSETARFSAAAQFSIEDDHHGTSKVAYISPLAYDGRVPASERPQPATTETTVRLWGLLHHLWEISGLNRWYPGWSRDWGFVRHALLKRASKVEVNDAPLSLYVPRVYQPALKPVIDTEWGAFMQPLLENRKGSANVCSAFVLGVVRSMERHPNGFLLRLQHHGPPIMVPSNMAENLSRKSRRGWGALFLDDEQHSKCRVVAMVRVEASSSGMVVAADCVLMRVHTRFIPSSNVMEDTLCSALLHADAEFVRPLSYEQTHGTLPSFAHRRMAEEGVRITELYCLPKAHPAAQAAEIENDQRNAAARHGNGFWIWSEAKAARMPELDFLDKEKTP